MVHPIMKDPMFLDFGGQRIGPGQHLTGTLCMLCFLSRREAKKGFGDCVPERGLGPAAPTYPI